MTTFYIFSMPLTLASPTVNYYIYLVIEADMFDGRKAPVADESHSHISFQIVFSHYKITMF